MDFNQNNQQNNQQNDQLNQQNRSGGSPYSQNPYRPLQANTFTILSFYLAIAAVLSTCTVYFSFVFGSISILFALLSKGYHKKMHKFSTIGIVISSISIGFTTLLIIFSFYTIFSNPSGQQLFMERLNSVFESQYGISFYEYIIENNDVFLQK